MQALGELGKVRGALISIKRSTSGRALRWINVGEFTLSYRLTRSPTTPTFTARIGRIRAKYRDELERISIVVGSQKYLPGARLFRAFNTKSHMYYAQEANRPDPKLTVPIAGDDPEVERAVGVGDAGFDPVIIGKLIDAKLLQRGPPAAARG